MIQIISKLSLLFILGLAASILVHDLHINSFITSHHYKHVNDNKYVSQSDPHVHPERASRSLLHGFAYGNVSITPREKRSGFAVKHVSLMKGRHAFDDMIMPVLA